MINRIMQRCLSWFDQRLLRFSKWAESFNPYVPESLSRDGIEPIKIEEDSIKRQAGKVVLIVFILFIAWAVFAPLDQGVVVSGTVVVQGSRKAIQHPKGGVVEKIFVHEGDKVNEGDVVLTINPLQIEAELRQAENDFINASAMYSRLLAERTDSNMITWDTELNEFNKEPQLQKAKDLQIAIFRSRRKEINNQRAILLERTEGLVQQITNKNKILKLRQEQMGPYVEDANSLRSLSNDGFIPRRSATDADRGVSDLQTGIISLQVDIENVKTQLASNELELSKFMSSLYREMDIQLAELQKLKETLRSKVLSLRFDKSLCELRAPVSGVVVGLSVFTEGGVITSGQLLMEIVPEHRNLIAQVAVPPYLIDKVHVGMTTDMRFSAFNMITTPVVPGIVRLVGADRLPPKPPQFPEEYFLAQVEATDEALMLLGNQVVLPGMPVEVIVKSGERTFMNYMLKPLTDRLARSFKD